MIFHHTHGYDKKNWLRGVFCCPLCHQKIDKKRSPEAISRAVKRGLAEKKKSK